MQRNTHLYTYLFLCQVVSEIIETAWSHAYTEVIFVTKNRGKPEQYPHVIFDNFTSHVYSLKQIHFLLYCNSNEFYSVCLFSVYNVIHVGFLFSFGQMGKRVASMLKHMFPVPKLDARHIIANKSDYVIKIMEMSIFIHNI